MKAGNNLDDIKVPVKTELLGNVIIDKPTIRFLTKEKENIQILGKCGIYIYKDYVDNTIWYKQKQYMHQMERTDV